MCVCVCVCVCACARASVCDTRACDYQVTWHVWQVGGDTWWNLIFCKRQKTAILPLFSFFFFFFFRVAPIAYGRSQDRGQIRAAAAGHSHSHSDARSEPCLQPTPQLMAMPDPLTHQVRPGIKPTSSWILVLFLTYWATTGTPKLFFFHSRSYNVLTTQ